MRTSLSKPERCFLLVNITVLSLQAYCLLHFLGCLFIPFMQRLRCPYLTATGRGCILCGYTRMTMNWLKHGEPVNFALAYFLFCFFTQFLLRIGNAIWLLSGRRCTACYCLADSFMLALSWCVSLFLFILAHPVVV